MKKLLIGGFDFFSVVPTPNSIVQNSKNYHWNSTDATLSPWKPGFHCESNIAVAVMYSAAAAHRNP